MPMPSFRNNRMGGGRGDTAVRRPKGRYFIWQQIPSRERANLGLSQPGLTQLAPEAAGTNRHQYDSETGEGKDVYPQGF